MPGLQTNLPSFRFNFGVVRVFKYGTGVGGMYSITGGGLFPEAITKVTLETEDDALVLSVRVIPTEKVPAVVGIPEICPDPLRESPDGSAPAEIVVASGVIPELNCMESEKEIPT